MAAGPDGPGSRSDQVAHGGQLGLSDSGDLEEVLDGIDRVEARHVHAAARKVIRSGRGALAAVGRVRALRRVHRVLSR